MYEIGPDKAATGLYEVGKGNAQVFDLSITERAIARNQKNVEAKRAARAKAGVDSRKRATDLMNKKIGQVHPADVEAFKARSSQYRKAVEDAFRSGENISIEEEARLNQGFGAMMSNSLASKQRFDMEKAELGKINSPTGNYDSRTKAKADEDFAISSFNPDGTFDASARVKGIARKKFGEYAEKASDDRLQKVDANKKMGKTDWSQGNAAEDAGHLLDDHEMRYEFSQMIVDLDEQGKLEDLLTEVYTSPTDEYGNVNPSYSPDGVPDGVTAENADLEAIVKYKHQNQFMVDGRDPLPSAYVAGGTIDSKMPITHYDPNTGLLNTYTGPNRESALATNVSYRGKAVNATPPYNVKINPKTGKVEHGWMTIKPTAEQAKVNTSVRNANTKNETKINELRYERRLMKKPERIEGKTLLGNDKETKAEYQKRVDDYNAKVVDIIDAYPIKPIPHPEESVKLTPEEVRQYYGQTWSAKIEDVFNAKGNTPGQKWIAEDVIAKTVPADEARMQAASEANAAEGELEVITSKAAFDALPKGAKYKKSDGKTYTKG